MAGQAKSMTMDAYTGEFVEAQRGDDIAARMSADGFGAVLALPFGKPCDHTCGEAHARGL